LSVLAKIVTKLGSTFSINFTVGVTRGDSCEFATVFIQHESSLSKTKDKENKRILESVRDKSIYVDVRNVIAAGQA